MSGPRVESHRLSHPGGRAVNEDACGELQVGDASCWVVADGLGGHRGGAEAAGLAVRAVLDSFRADPSISTAALRAHFDAAHQAILQAQAADSSLSRMQTTLVVLASNGVRAIWGHAGDSRLYLLRGGRIGAQTRDHTVAQAKIDAAESPVRDPREDEDRNRLLQAAGKLEGFRPAILDEPMPLRRGDAFLLCVDGFWAKVYEPEIEIEFAKADDAPAWLAGMERRLASRVAPGDDNYTAIVVRALNPALPPPVGRPAAGSHRDVLSFAGALFLFLLLALSFRRFPAERTRALPQPPSPPRAPAIALAPPVRSAPVPRETPPPPPAKKQTTPAKKTPPRQTPPETAACRWERLGVVTIGGKPCYGVLEAGARGLNFQGRPPSCDYRGAWKFSEVLRLDVSSANDSSLVTLQFRNAATLAFSTNKKVTSEEAACVNRQAAGRR